MADALAGAAVAAAVCSSVAAVAVAAAAADGDTMAISVVHLSAMIPFRIMCSEHPE